MPRVMDGPSYLFVEVVRRPRVVWVEDTLEHDNPHPNTFTIPVVPAQLRRLLFLLQGKPLAIFLR